MAKKYADMRIELTVAFDDDGKTDLKTQAWDALDELMPMGITAADWFAGGEVVGEVRDSEFPA